MVMSMLTFQAKPGREAEFERLCTRDLEVLRCEVVS